MKLIEFLKAKPKVAYEYVSLKGDEIQNWEFRWTGIFGKGYYQLTKNGRRHPKGSFKVMEQVFRELERGYCKIV